MEFKKISGPIKLTAGTNGAQVEFPLQPRSGGRSCKVVQVMAKLVSSGGTAPTLGMKIDHGPDGFAHSNHTTIANTGIPASNLWVFDSDATKIIGEFIHLVPVAGGTATGDYVVVEFYEMPKPF
jgi:hypothetical protein